MPLPSTKPIPDGWDDHHRPVATAAMTATCTVDRITGRVKDPVTKQYTNTYGRIHAGPCRIQAGGVQAQAVDVAGQMVTTSSYLVALEHDAAAIEVEDIVTVTAAADTLLVGRKLRVLTVQHGSNQWQRNLTCEDWEG